MRPRCNLADFTFNLWGLSWWDIPRAQAPAGGHRGMTVTGHRWLLEREPLQAPPVPVRRGGKRVPGIETATACSGPGAPQRLNAQRTEINTCNRPQKPKAWRGPAAGRRSGGHAEGKADAEGRRPATRNLETAYCPHGLFNQNCF